MLIKTYVQSVKTSFFKNWRHVFFYQLSNFSMQDGIQDGSQDIKNVFFFILTLVFPV